MFHSQLCSVCYTVVLKRAHVDETERERLLRYRNVDYPEDIDG